MESIRCVATAAFGIESVLAHEIRALGFEGVEVFNGYVEYDADLRGICRSNLWLRTAERVFIKVGAFGAESFEELFQGVKALPWERWLDGDSEFPVSGKSVKSKLFSVSDCQAITKKAVVERMKAHTGIDWFPEKGPKFPILVSLLRDQAVLLLDTSGEGLHRRGYRARGNEAPLKETLASALVQLSRWRPDQLLADPFCGTGTLLIEAAMLARNIAPGLNRKFVSETWPGIPAELWRAERREAYSAIRTELPLQLAGTDKDPQAIRTARINAEEAGVEDCVTFDVQDAAAFQPHGPGGVIVTNPPYGERMGEVQEVEALYRLLGQKMKGLEGWALNVITAYEGFEKVYGLKAQKNRKIYNGRIKCYYYQYPALRPAGRGRGGE